MSAYRILRTGGAERRRVQSLNIETLPQRDWAFGCETDGKRSDIVFPAHLIQSVPDPRTGGQFLAAYYENNGPGTRRGSSRWPWPSNYFVRGKGLRYQWPRSCPWRLDDHGFGRGEPL